MISNIQDLKEIAAGEKLLPLPEQLTTSQQRIDLCERITTLLNNKRYDELYNILDDRFKVRLTKDELAKTADNMVSLTGHLDSGTYTHYEAKKQGELKQYDMYYLVKAEKGNFRMKITVLQDGSEPYKIFGFSLEGL